MSAPSPGFLDVPTLLQRSMPRAGITPTGLGLASIVIIMLAIGYLAGSGNGGTGEAISGLALIALLGLMVWLSWRGARRLRAEREQLEALEELVQLRRWKEAAEMLQRLLSRPMRLVPARIGALIYLSMVLARYHRWADAITVHEYILEHVRLDDVTHNALLLGRAMALLHEDRLVDADRAIGELRRGPAGPDAGGLALVEIYRDIRTGHPAEAIEIFNKRLPAMRAMLGVRVADAWALAARAYDTLGQGDAAKEAWNNATLLVPAIELTRRYPETAAMSDRYPAAAVPAEAAP